MTIRWGIIGCGNVTEVKSGPALQQARGSKLVAVMRRNGELAADYARRHGVPKWTTEADEIIHDPEVDAVYVATPPGSHLRYLLVEAAWKARRLDPALMMSYDSYLEQMPPQKAIIRIARKLLARIRHVWLTQRPYQSGIVE